MVESSPNSKQVENTVGNREIACYEQFLLFPQCFQKTCSVDTCKPGLVWKRVNLYFSKDLFVEFHTLTSTTTEEHVEIHSSMEKAVKEINPDAEYTGEFLTKYK